MAGEDAAGAEPRLIFAGTPDFALASLRSLCRAGLRPVAVLTQPDRPAGRGRRLTASPVKSFAVDEGIPVLQPATLRDGEALGAIESLEADALIVAAYGLILPPPVLALPALGCINVHASLLPRWRGASPIQAAVLAGDTVSGVSLMRMEAGLDTGPVYAHAEVSVGPRDTAGDLHDRLAALGGDLLVDRLPAILTGRLAPEPQDDSLATYAPRIRREEARIDWTRSATRLDREVRAYNPWPVSHCLLDGDSLRIWRAEPGQGASDAAPGTVLRADGAGIEVVTGDGTLRLLEVQMPGRRRIAASDLANQRRLDGLQLG